MSTENKHRSIVPSIPYHNKSVLDDKCDGTRSKDIIIGPGADPGFRRGGGVRTFRRGGGFVQEFQERIQIVAGSWANQQAKKNCRQP